MFFEFGKISRCFIQAAQHKNYLFNKQGVIKKVIPQMLFWQFSQQSLVILEAKFYPHV